MCFNWCEDIIHDAAFLVMTVIGLMLTKMITKTLLRNTRFINSIIQIWLDVSSVTSWSNFVHAREIYENLFARRQLVKTPNLKHKRLIYELTEKPE